MGVAVVIPLMFNGAGMADAQYDYDQFDQTIALHPAMAEELVPMR